MLSLLDRLRPMTDSPPIQRRTESSCEHMMAKNEPAEAETSPPLWRVRVCLPGSIIHLVSLTEPVVHMHDGRIGGVSMNLVTDTPEAGDAIGFIDWPTVIALTWRTMKQERAEA
jgi:hypothetical protein